MTDVHEAPADAVLAFAAARVALAVASVPASVMRAARTADLAAMSLVHSVLPSVVPLRGVPPAGTSTRYPLGSGSAG
jgi:hypothetical protein